MANQKTPGIFKNRIAKTDVIKLVQKIILV
jgi:hypothetical protein